MDDPSIARLIRIYKDFKGYQHILRRVFLIRIMTTLDGFSIEKLDELRQEQGVGEEEKLTGVLFHCHQCGHKVYTYMDYKNHLVEMHLHWSLLTENERIKFQNVKRIPFTALGLGEEDGMTYEEQNTFSVELEDA